MKKIIIILALILLQTGCSKDDISRVINKGMYLYVSAPYKRYYDYELVKYFEDNIVKDIKHLYMPYIYDSDGMPEIICFEESNPPDIKILNVERKDKNLYWISVKFGQSEFEYDIALNGRKISNIEKRLNY